MYPSILKKNGNGIEPHLACRRRSADNGLQTQEWKIMSSLWHTHVGTFKKVDKPNRCRRKREKLRGKKEWCQLLRKREGKENDVWILSLSCAEFRLIYAREIFRNYKRKQMSIRVQNFKSQPPDQIVSSVKWNAEEVFWNSMCLDRTDWKKTGLNGFELSYFTGIIESRWFYDIVRHIFIFWLEQPAT